jgi:transglutaminase-like putative cysteine protease
MAGQQQVENLTIAVAMRRYFDVCLYLLIFTGFGTLASTGHLDLATVLVVTCALLFRGYILARRRQVLLSERWTNLLTIVCVAFYIADEFLISRSFLTATVHLVLFVMLVRLFSAQRDRDHYLLAVLAFLMVLAAAVLTVDSTFLFALGGFILVAIPTFILMEMTHAAQKARVQARDPQIPHAYRRLSFAIAGLAPLLLGLIFAGTALIFFVLPRVSTGYLGVRSMGNDLTTGFSDRVELGRIGQIQQLQTVVMHVQIDKNALGGYPLKLRGVALNEFDGRIWRSTATKVRVNREKDGHFVLPSRSGQPNSQGTIHYRVTMEPILSEVFFLLATPRSLEGNYRYISQDEAGDVFDMDPEHPVTRYEADSTIRLRPSPRALNSSAAYTPEILSTYLQMPPSLDPRIEALAREIAANGRTPLQRASLMENYLRAHYTYALEVSSGASRDPIATFLFVRRRGHCEYFASAMALMLRSIGIPSRVVNGFAGNEYNHVSSRYVIRASDAHSWVEVYVPGEGWTEFDPTPSSANEHEQWSRVMLYMDALASFWREWIVNYDVAHQLRLTENASRGSREIVARAQAWTRSRYERMLAWARRTQARLGQSGVKLGVWTLAVIGVPMILFSVPRLLSITRRFRLARKPQAAPQLAATIWYQKMLRQTARQGWRKVPEQTPAEFVSAIGDAELRSQVSAFTKHYQKARFGGSAQEVLELPKLYAEIARRRPVA